MKKNILIDFFNRNISICIFILVFLISFFITYVFVPMSSDTAWLYGFSYNISKGLVIYRDFNVVTTPLYYFITSIFIKILGNYIISMELFNALLVATSTLMMFKVIKWKAFIVFPLILVFFPNGYNLFSLFWLMLILYLINKKKDNDILLGFIIGLSFITKQNIGFVLLIPYLFYCKNKIKGIITFSIPIMLLSIYLLYNNAFYEFIDYCFLGLFNFNNENFYFNYYYIIELFIICYLLFKLFNSKFKDKEVFYILMFQVIIYPLPDVVHFFVAFFPVAYYFVKDIKEENILWILFINILVFTIFLCFNITNGINLKKDLFFLKNSGNLSILLQEFHDYLQDTDYYFFTENYGYSYKIYYNETITKYDLLNEGNHGHKGIENTINEIDKMCIDKKCVFIADKGLGKHPASQTGKISNYIDTNYDIVVDFGNFYIYSNKNKKDANDV